MQTLISTEQMKNADANAVVEQRISSVDLMENAAKAFVKAFEEEVTNKHTPIAILCGKGNNGGDGLAIARLLINAKYRKLKVYIIDFSDKQSADFSVNLKRLKKMRVEISWISDTDAFNLEADVVIDAILGAGLNKPLAGAYAELAKKVNDQKLTVIAVDVPTGFKGEGSLIGIFNGIKADLVICFQRPKINFFLPESAGAMDRFKVVDIGLSEDFIEAQTSVWKLTQSVDIRKLLKRRKNFSHKGTYGHALIVAGSENTMGAAILCAKGCLFAGAGLTSVYVPKSGFVAINTALPEVMTLSRDQPMENEALSKYNAIAFGPGLGINADTEAFAEQLISLRAPLVVDADGLTILANRRRLLDQLPPRTILTPHMKEFDRLFGVHESWWQRLETAITQATERGIIIVLKNQFTFVVLPTGEVRINPTGNPAMASGGMGDVLTGIITSLLAQGYLPDEAAIIGVYLHGKVGDKKAKKRGVVVASEIAAGIAKEVKEIESRK